MPTEFSEDAYRPLEAARVEALRSARVTYDASLIGRTMRDPRPPSPYLGLRHARVIGHGPETFSAAREALRSWRVQQRAGLGIRADGDALTEGTHAVLRIGLAVGGRRPIGLDAPARVVAVADQPALAGFAYGTLPGHPEEGEESFVLSLASDGTIRFTVTAFSRPAARLARLGGRVTTLVQHRMADRYLRALDER